VLDPFCGGGSVLRAALDSRSRSRVVGRDVSPLAVFCAAHRCSAPFDDGSAARFCRFVADQRSGDYDALFLLDRSCPRPPDAARFRCVHLRPGEGVSLAACEADGSLHAHVLIPSASARRRFELGPRALDLLRGAGEAAPVSLPAGCYAWAHAPGERGVRVGLGERFEAREFPGRPRGHWAALVGLAGPDLVGRYGGDLPALLRDYGGVAGGVLEVDESGALDKWICFNGRLRDPCDGVALARRAP